MSKFNNSEAYEVLAKTATLHAVKFPGVKAAAADSTLAGVFFQAGETGQSVSNAFGLLSVTNRCSVVLGPQVAGSFTVAVAHEGLGTLGPDETFEAGSSGRLAKMLLRTTPTRPLTLRFKGNWSLVAGSLAEVETPGLGPTPETKATEVEVEYDTEDDVTAVELTTQNGVSVEFELALAEM